MIAEPASMRISATTVYLGVLCIAIAVLAVAVAAVTAAGRSTATDAAAHANAARVAGDVLTTVATLRCDELGDRVAVDRCARALPQRSSDQTTVGALTTTGRRGPYRYTAQLTISSTVGCADSPRTVPAGRAALHRTVTATVTGPGTATATLDETVPAPGHVLLVPSTPGSVVTISAADVTGTARAGQDGCAHFYGTRHHVVAALAQLRRESRTP